MSVHFITTVYCNENVFRAGMKELRRTTALFEMRATHWLLNQHYPLGGDETKQAIAEYAGMYGNVRVFDCGRNLGLHDGLQFLVDQIEPLDDDVVVGFDPDEKPLSDGWAHAMVDVM